MLVLRHCFVLLGATAMLGLGACTKKNDVEATDGGDLADAGAAADADPNLLCTPDSTSCQSDVLTTCASDGLSTSPSICALGCFDGLRCNKVDPSNGLATLLDMAATGPELVFNGTAIINTTTETITDDSGPVVVPTSVESGGPVEVFVIRVKSMTANKIVVTGSRALAIVSDGPVALNLGLEADADLNTPAPGSLDDNATCRPRDAGGSDPNWPGGGGGGFGGNGGAGGEAHAVSGGLGSTPNGAASLVPLRGGCDGGDSQTGSGMTLGGGGGGAVQIVSNTSIVVPATGYVSAGGGGATGRPVDETFCVFQSPCYPGAGGGSGGGILLEAPSVVVAPAAGLYANGGSGSCSEFGKNATRSETRASGGDCSAIAGRGNGGAGGAGLATAGIDGQDLGVVESGRGGGGGGGVGRIRINLPAGGNPSAIEGTVSPAASFGSLSTR